MARCGCSGASCSCLIVAGSGVEVSGSGIESNPYVIDVVGSDIAGTITVADTATINLSRSGSGSSADPYVISGVATVSMDELTDTSGSPVTGDVPVFDGTNWVFAPPPTTPPGAVSATDGITGDGSAGAPLRAATSGTWGVAPLDIFGTNTLLGGQVYLDANGQLRSRPPGIDVIASAAGRPSQYPGRVYVRSDTLNSGWSNGTTWAPFAVASPAMVPVPRYRCRLAADLTLPARPAGGSPPATYLGFTIPYAAQFHAPMGAIEYRLVSGQHRYYALVDGVFQIEAETQWTGAFGAGVGSNKLGIWFNDNTAPLSSTEDARAGSAASNALAPGIRTRVSLTLPLLTGDWFKIGAFNNSNTASSIIAAHAAAGGLGYADSSLTISQVGSSTRTNFTP